MQSASHDAAQAMQGEGVCCEPVEGRAKRLSVVLRGRSYRCTRRPSSQPSRMRWLSSSTFKVSAWERSSAPQQQSREARNARTTSPHTRHVAPRV
eukprot:2028235-Pyramimonas_sp.AAC.1